ncbi:6665_t:CDS:2 [Diversispora eburnea]|uniref:6665_t:CDS:1 n=1 Tax=Diversispora eburnea TaxID=1213867 RepID=A0A9N8VWA7_9GLOM|nr:6665_t:CDS:2 [Diversispora eburnea]
MASYDGIDSLKSFFRNESLNKIAISRAFHELWKRNDIQSDCNRLLEILIELMAENLDKEITPGDYRVLVKESILPVLTIENMYETFCQTHAEITQHGGQRQTRTSIKAKWGSIRQSIIDELVNNCTICAVRKPSFHPLSAKPIIAKNFLSRVQIDLIDLSYDADGEYKYICHVRDHFTRFSWAKSLTSKRAVEVAAYLFDLFHFLGSPPTILQSDNGKEFCASVIKELISLWLSVKIINGHPQHPQSQAHKKTPYELVYGDKPRGNSTLIEDLFQKKIYDEENIEMKQKIVLQSLRLQCQIGGKLDMGFS